MKRLISILTWLCLASTPWTAFAVDGDISAQQSEMDENDILEAELKEAQVPDGSEDYAEMNEMRVLERALLGAEDVALPQTDASNLVPPGDPFELSHASVLDMLLADVGEDQTQGLQQQSTRIMAQALNQVNRIMETEEVADGLVKPFGLDVFDQPAVREYLALYSASGSKGFKVWLARAGKWREIVEQVMREEGVPGDLLYLAMIESGFKTRVKSPKAAGGMWQFMPGTAVEQGLRIDAYVDERFDPIKAAHAAARYLKKQYARYDSWPLAMAAYNGGPGLVNVAIDKYNTNDFFKLVKYGAMFDETRRYAPKILAAAIIGKNPAAFGFEGLKVEKSLKFDAVEVPGATRLEKVADAAGCDLDTIQELNPELLKNQTPPDEPWTVRIPQGSSARFVEKFDNLSSKYQQTESLDVKFGQTIELIAEQSGSPARVIRALNKLDWRENAIYGQSLLVPKGTVQKLRDYAQKRQAEIDAGAIKDENKRLTLIPKPEFELPNYQRVFYCTQKNDRIDAVAQAFGVTTTQLALWNDLDVYARLRPNMMLQIYLAPGTKLDGVVAYDECELNIIIKGSEAHQELLQAKSKNTQSKAKAAAKSGKGGGSSVTYHTVVKGDSLSKIAKKYGVTVEQLLKWNKLKDAGSIRKGQKLVVKK